MANSYKIGFVKNLLLRAFRISRSWSIFDEESEHIYKILQEKYFPKFHIDQIVLSFMTTQVREAKNSPVACNEAAEEIRYFKLPYIGKVPKSLQNKMDKISASFCKSSKVKISFTPFEIGQYFSLKRSHSERVRFLVCL